MSRCSIRSGNSSRPTPDFDIDALRIVAEGVRNATEEQEHAVLVITAATT